ncbi:dihydropteroate synthase [Ulvibacter antarcticus]|nr:dihydropteroate synthase [Ulvibacter antarcticus]
MGIINCTPDSFYDGGKTVSIREIVAQADKMLNEGATFLDVGGYSSRPGAEDVSEEEELKRVIPAITAILKAFPKTLISIDTFRSEVAKKAIEVGACMINDISGGLADQKMMETVAGLKVPYVLMHMKGTPQNMVENTAYENVTKEVLFYFSGRISEARKAGINDVIIDPGFGFAKTRKQSFELLKQLELFQHLDLPILVGVSRKSMIYKSLESTAEKALNGTSVLNTVAIMKGASILRVHDVAEAVECVQLLENLKNNS